MMKFSRWQEQFIYERYVKRIGLGLDICFFLIHSVMLVSFRLLRVWPMFYFNIFSVTMYIFAPILLYRNRFSVFVQLLHLEVVTHMTLAIYFVGWGSGFQIAILGFNIFLVYAEYLSTSLNMKRVHSLLLCTISMLLYIGVCVADYHHTPRYLMPPESAYIFRVGWAASVFVITIFFLQLFAHLASRMQKQLAEEAMHDRLTGLPNRYYMTEYLDKALAERASDGLWLAIADIDDFKQVNDVYGHNCGDYVLKTLASLAREHDPKVEVCRWGGEEFLLTGSADGAEAPEACLTRLRRRVENYAFVYEGRTLRLTVTIGLAIHQPGESAEAWINRADMKLYSGKNSGKNKVVA